MSAEMWWRSELVACPPETALQLHLDRGDNVLGILVLADLSGVTVRVEDGAALIPWPLIRWVQIDGPARRKLEADAARRKPKTKATA